MELIKKIDKGMEGKEYFCAICQKTHTGVPPTMIVSTEGTKRFFVCNLYIVMLRNKRGEYKGRQGYDGTSTLFV
jgi:hypothetical protein